jgi:hypothetical protein
MAKQPSLFLTSPVVEVQWAYIDAPDTKFVKTGVYQADLLLDIAIPEHKAFLSKVKAALPQGYTVVPWSKVEGREGVFALKVKQNAVVVSNGKQYEIKPKVYDAKRQILSTVPRIGNGSKVSVYMEVRPYDLKGIGIRLNPVALQIIELVEYSEEAQEAQESDCPFGVVESGYVADTFPGEQPTGHSTQAYQAPVDEFANPSQSVGNTLPADFEDDFTPPASKAPAPTAIDDF